MFIYHHLGLGDHISCHGIVRHYCEQYPKVSLFVKPHNKDNVSYMYNDLKNLELIEADDEYTNHYILYHNLKNVLYVGFKLNTIENFIVQFYNMANVPIEYEYKKFYINRNIDEEKKLFDSLGVKENQYIFAHDSAILGSDLITKHNLPIIAPTYGKFFDWIYTIQNAKEIHCIDSAFICLVDLLDTKTIPLFNHRYIKNYPHYISIVNKPHKKWTTI